MKSVIRLLTAILLSHSLATVASARMFVIPMGTNVAPPRYITLWNGHDLTGWQTFSTNADMSISKQWAAKNNVLSLTGKPTGYLRTERTFSNYHLHAEWRWTVTNGNSGVLVHVGGSDAIWPRSIECQLKPGAAGELISQGDAKFSAPTVDGHKHAKITTPSEKPIGQWNALDVYCRGNTVKTQVNGVRQNLVERVSVASGAIGLQLEGSPIEFRLIWVELY